MAGVVMIFLALHPDGIRPLRCSLGQASQCHL